MFTEICVFSTYFTMFYIIKLIETKINNYDASSDLIAPYRDLL